MDSSHIPAIDVHAHYGNRRFDHAPLLNEMLSAGPGAVVQRARDNNVELTVVSPMRSLVPRGRGTSDVWGGNIEAAQVTAKQSALRQWVVVDPTRPESYEQARDMLAQPQCVGIKIHPEEHSYPIGEFGAAFFEFAAELGAVVLTHSGHGFSLPKDFVPFANEYPEVRLILAHIGCSENQDPSLQVRALQQSQHGNIYADTSSAMSITPDLIEWAVGEVGHERILFGTDSPLYHTGMQRIRIDQAEISDQAKRQILRENALRLLDLERG